MYHSFGVYLTYIAYVFNLVGHRLHTIVHKVRTRSAYGLKPNKAVEIRLILKIHSCIHVLVKGESAERRPILYL